jgi:NTP pyrophosphatase (non-canonical NTP hydrolase)
MDRSSLLAIFRQIEAERVRQDEKFGVQVHDHFVWLAILSEEVGESAEAVLHTTFGDKGEKHLREELIQVAAVACAWIQSIDDPSRQRGEYNPSP